MRVVRYLPGVPLAEIQPHTPGLLRRSRSQARTVGPRVEQTSIIRQCIVIFTGTSRTAIE